MKPDEPRNSASGLPVQVSMTKILDDTDEHTEKIVGARDQETEFTQG